jgi:hypothetical protein
MVHEGDYSDVLLQRQSVSKDDVIEVIDFIEKVAKSIYNTVKESS